MLNLFLGISIFNTIHSIHPFDSFHAAVHSCCEYKRPRVPPRKHTSKMKFILSVLLAFLVFAQSGESLPL